MGGKMNGIRGAPKDVLESHHLVTSSGAVLDMENSCRLVNSYVEALGLDHSSRTKVYMNIVHAPVHETPPMYKKRTANDPEPGSTNTCILTLPGNAGLSPISSAGRFPGKNMAKHSAAFQACKALLDAGELDSNLAPTPKNRIVHQKRKRQRSHTLDAETDAEMQGKEEDSKLGDIIVSGEAARRLGNRRASKHRSSATQSFEKVREAITTRLPPKAPIGKSGMVGFQEYPRHTEAEFWTSCGPLTNDQLYPTLLELVLDDPYSERSRECRTMCLITSQPLPIFQTKAVFELDVGTTNVGARMRLIKGSKMKTWENGKLERAHEFTVKTLRATMNRPMAGELETTKFVFVPMKRDYVIPIGKAMKKHIVYVKRRDVAWSEVEAASGPVVHHFDMEDMDSLDSQIEDVLITSGPTLFGRKFHVASIRRDLSPSSLAPDPNNSACSTIGQVIFERTWDKRKPPPPPKILQYPDQPILECSLALAAKNGGFVSSVKQVGANQFFLPETCFKLFLPASAHKMCSVFPAFFFSLDECLLATQMNDTIFQGILDNGVALQALTSPSARPHHSYERLEYLGDAILKLASTVYVYQKHKHSNEHRMTHERHLLVSNRILHKFTTDSGVVNYIIIGGGKLREYVPVNWRYVAHPPREPREGNEKQPDVEKTTEEGGPVPKKIKSALQVPAVVPKATVQFLGDKTVADVAESLIATAYISNDRDIDFALRAMQTLQIPLADFNSWSDVVSLAREEQGTAVQEGSNRLTWDNLLGPKKIQPVTILGYTFNDPRKGSTCLSLAGKAKFEIYEFLGDAVLGFLDSETQWRCHPEATPDALTRAKTTFSAFAVLSGLVDRLRDVEPSIQTQIEQYKSDFVQARDAIGDEPIFWSDVPHHKFLGDVVEAVFGAIFEDSNFSLSTITEVFQTTLLPFLDQYTVMPRSGTVHPKGLFCEWMDKRPCGDWEIVKRSSNEKGEGVTILCHKVVIGEASASTQQLAIRKVCSQVLGNLDSGILDLEPICDCKAKAEDGAKV
ncbi:hypothetical protein P7C73_g2104, partial [Tremellales sp. Uapishka_1]